jgi:hypothetical protein
MYVVSGIMSKSQSKGAAQPLEQLQHMSGPAISFQGLICMHYISMVFMSF